jgi:hypothetical protein
MHEAYSSTPQDDLDGPLCLPLSTGPSPKRLSPHLESFVGPIPPRHSSFTSLCTQVPTYRTIRPYIQSMALSFHLPFSPIPNLTAIFHKTEIKRRRLHIQVISQSSSSVLGNLDPTTPDLNLPCPYCRH